MIRNWIIAAGLILVAALVLSACSGQSAALAPTAAPVQPTVAHATQSSAMAAPTQAARPATAPGDLTRTNEGGSVTFAITPLNLGSGAATLDLDVSMNTHSVELGAFDLKQLAVLKTDTGTDIQPSAYKGGGGHHVEGKLSFPADKLVGVRTLTLVIKNVAGVPERTFTWNLL